MKDNTTTLVSPCIGHCCLDDRDVCLGCFRHLDEILSWRDADDQRKQDILDRVAARKAQSTNPYIAGQ